MVFLCDSTISLCSVVIPTEPLHRGIPHRITIAMAGWHTADELQEAIISKWPAVQVEKLINADSASGRVHGWLSLHFACCNQAAPSVVTSLLAANPGAVKEPTADKSLPLHFALGNKCDEQVIHMLLDAHPHAAMAATQMGWTPLHTAVANEAPQSVVVARLLRINPKAAAAKNSFAQLPIWVAMERGAPAGHVALLIDAYPAGVKLRDEEQAWLPLHNALHFGADMVQLLLRAWPESAKQLVGQSMPSSPEYTPHVAIVERAPVQTLAMLLKLWLEAAKTKDQYGNFPFESALDFAKETPSLALLLKACPRAGDVAIKTGPSDVKKYVDDEAEKFVIPASAYVGTALLAPGEASLHAQHMEHLAAGCCYTIETGPHDALTPVAIATLALFGVRVVGAAASMRRAQPGGFWEARRSQLEAQLSASGASRQGLRLRQGIHEIIAWLRSLLHASFNLQDVSADAALMQTSIRSNDLIRLAEQLNAAFETQLPPTFLFDHCSIRAIAEHLAGADGSLTRVPVRVEQLKPSALVSHSLVARLGGTPRAAQVSALQAAAGNAIRQVPSSRWLPAPASPDAARHGAFVAGAQHFDNAFFGVSPAEAGAMDPQQRLLLEVGYTSLHSVRERLTSLRTADAGAFLGIMNTDFAALQMEDSVYAGTGATISVADGRLSCVLGTQGACVSVDTPCSSALVSLHGASCAVAAGECSQALMLVVSLMLTPRTHEVYARGGMLSDDGRCKAFDARANGYVRCECIGAISLSNHARGPTLLGSHVRSNGKSASLTAPNGMAQARLLREALAAGAVERLRTIEAHATGTSRSDPTEAGGLERALGASSPCVGGAKANVGHMEPAAALVGLVGLWQSSMQRANGVNAQLRVLNALLVAPLCGLAAFLSTQGMMPTCTVAGVSSFGYSGTIAHAVLGFGHTSNRTALTRRHAVDSSNMLASGFSAEAAGESLAKQSLGSTLVCQRRSTFCFAVLVLAAATSSREVPLPGRWRTSGHARRFALGQSIGIASGTRGQARAAAMTGKPARAGVARLRGGGVDQVKPVSVDSYDNLLAAVLDVVSGILEGQRVAPTTPMMDAGLDSLTAERFASGVLLRTGMAIEPTAVFEHPTAEAVALHLAERCGLRAPSVWPRCREPADPLAIQGANAGGLAVAPLLHIGDGAQRWPGGVHPRAALETLLDGGGDALGSPPSQRWTLENEVDVRTLSAAQLKCIQHGGYIEAERFDAAAFHLSPAEIGWMDPQQRLLLELGYASLHAHGARKPDLLGSGAGHFLGMSKADWSRNQFARRGGYANYSVYATTCDSNTVASGRLSFVLGLHGPCETVDTACSSSLVALQNARLSVDAAECDVAVVTAVRLELTLQHTLDAAFAAMLSLNGRCFTLDRRADGYVSSEGVGAIVIASLPPDGPHLAPRAGAARFRRGAVRCDGRSASLTAPNGAAQAAMLAAANQDTPSLSLLELHGTGTALGDPTETSSLARVLDGRGGKDGPIGVGGAKGSFGHTMAASGALGLAKLLLQFDHVATMGNRQLRALNPLILSSVKSLRACPRLPTQALGVARHSEDFCGGVSSFGFSGTISSVALSHPGALRSAQPSRRRSRLRHRRTRFAWVKRTTASASTLEQSRPALALYSTCWATADGDAAEPASSSRPWLLLATHLTAAPLPLICADASAVVVDGVEALDSSQLSLSKHHVALLLDGAKSASPSHLSAHTILHAVRRVVELDAGNRLLLLTFGMRPAAAGTSPARVSAAAHGGCSGLLYATRMEHVALRMACLDVGHTRRLPLVLNDVTVKADVEWSQAQRGSLQLVPRLRCAAALPARRAASARVLGMEPTKNERAVPC